MKKPDKKTADTLLSIFEIMIKSRLDFLKEEYSVSNMTDVEYYSRSSEVSGLFYDLQEFIEGYNSNVETKTEQ